MNLPLLGRVLGTIVFVIVLLVVVPLSQVADAMKRADPIWVAGGLVLGLLARVAAAERTYSISRPMNLSVSRRQTIETLFISNFWGLMLPGLAAGTVSTVYRYSTMGVPLSLSVGALGVSRIIEAVVYCASIFLAWTVVMAGQSLRGVTVVPLAMLSCATATIIVLFGLFRYLSTHASADAISLPRKAKSLRTRMIHVATAIRSVSPRACASAATFAAVQAVLDATSLGLFARGLGVSIDLFGAIWANGIVYIALLLPISISGLGARDAAIVAAASVLDVAAPDALAISILMLGATLANALLGGVVQLFTARASSSPTPRRV